MKEEKDYIRDIAEIRSMMERSSKFLSLSGWAGIMAGIYALAGAFIAYKVYDFNPGRIEDEAALSESFSKVVFLAVVVFVFAIVTAVFLSYKKAAQKGEKIWNATSRQLLMNMAVPFIAGGLMILIVMSKGFFGLIAPFTLLFYGLALFNASKFTYNAVKILGLVEIALGLLSAYLIDLGLLFWALGFGVAHIIYGIYIHYRYEK
jgi:hypothetical protein